MLCTPNIRLSPVLQMLCTPNIRLSPVLLMLCTPNIRLSPALQMLCTPNIPLTPLLHILVLCTQNIRLLVFSFCLSSINTTIHFDSRISHPVHQPNACNQLKYAIACAVNRNALCVTTYCVCVNARQCSAKFVAV
jgi:hypothetical protein